jgi:hypothetical protein
VLPVALPPIVAALLLVSWRGARMTALALSIGVFAAWCCDRYSKEHGWELPAWPYQLLVDPVGGQWLLWSIVGAGLVSWLELAIPLRGKIAVGVGVAFAALATCLVLQKLASLWSFAESVLHIGVGGAAAVLVVFAARASLVRGPATIAPAVVYTLLFSVLSVLMVVGAQDAPLGKLCGACAAAIGAAAGTSLWKKPFALAEADGTCLGAAWGLLVLAGTHLASLPFSAAVCAWLSPCALVLLRSSLAQRPLLWTIAALCFAGAPLVGAFAIVWATQGSSGY